MGVFCEHNPQCETIKNSRNLGIWVKLFEKVSTHKSLYLLKQFYMTSNDLEIPIMNS